MSNLAQPSGLSEPLLTLAELSRRARQAGSAAELRFLLVNDTHALVPYRQSAFWLEPGGLQALSGVLQIEANAPYAQWLEKVVAHCAAVAGREPAPIDRAGLPPALAAEWNEWLPEHGFWLPLPPHSGGPAAGGLLLARDHPWGAAEAFLLAEWGDAWRHAWDAVVRPAPLGRWWRRDAAAKSSRTWWKRAGPRWAAAALLVAMLPVRLTILAPAELVPARPETVRAPLEGVIGAFHVQPNEQVRKGQPLFVFDEALLRSRLEVSRQSLATAESEYRQALQQALSDTRSKAQLSVLTGKIEEKRAESAYLAEQLARAQVVSPRDGVVLFDDPSEWIGKPVAIGERIMRVAAPDDIEVEAWVGLGDAIPLTEGARVSLYLNAQPLSPVQAKLRYLAHEAVQRPDGSHAYRLRAALTEVTLHRVGLKGTARVDGQWVPLAYWVLRRPWASVRSFIGW